MNPPSPPFILYNSQNSLTEEEEKSKNWKNCLLLGRVLCVCDFLMTELKYTTKLFFSSYYNTNESMR